jgi:hypothetical protein
LIEEERFSVKQRITTEGMRVRYLRGLNPQIYWSMHHNVWDVSIKRCEEICFTYFCSMMDNHWHEWNQT